MRAGVFPAGCFQLADADNSGFFHFARMTNRITSLSQAMDLLLSGGILIYPTETYLAVGCDFANPDALATIYRLKRRPPAKPLPLIAASARHAAQICDLEGIPRELPEKFWPGPLTLLVPAKKPLAQALINPQHKVAIRVSSHPDAQKLAASCGGIIPATSANLSGRPPAATFGDLDPALTEAGVASANAPGLYLGAPGSKTARFAGPSTLVEPVFRQGRWIMRILRSGAVRPGDLANRKWDIES